MAVLPFNRIRITEEDGLKHEIFRGLEEVADDMNYSIDAVVVEGPHDKQTFKSLGYKNDILLCSKFSLNNLGDVASKKYSTVVILTDFDQEGIYLNKRLTKLLETRGVKVDNFYRRKIRKLLKATYIVTIEGISSLKLKLFS